MDPMSLLKRRNITDDLQKIAEKHRDIVSCPTETWKNDHNIIHLHKTVIKYLKSKIPRINELEKEKQKLNLKRKNSYGRIAISSIDQKISTIDKEIDEIRQSPDEYDKIAQDYLTVYRALIGKEECIEIRSLIVQKYLEMIQKYYPHRIFRDYGQIKDDKCPFDGTPLIPHDDNDEDHADERSICPKCNNVYEVCLDWKKVTISSKKKDYDPVNNFIKIIAHVEDEITVEFPVKL